MNKSLKNSPTPQETIPPHRMIWESYMKLRSNRGYIQGELNLVDKLDKFDSRIGMISLTSQIGSDGNFSD